MRERFVIGKRELAGLRSEKTIVLALIIQLFVAFFSSFIVVGLVTVFSPDSAGEGVEIDYAVTGDAAAEVTAAADTIGGANTEQYNSFETAYADFQRGNVDAILDTSRQDSGRIIVNVYAPETGVRNTVITVRSQAVLENLEETQREEFSSRLTYEPLSIDGTGDEAPFHSFTYTVLIPLLLILPAFISGSLASDVITEGVAEGTIELLRVGPLTEVEIIDAKVLSMILLAPVQAALWMVLISLNGIPVANIPVLVGLNLFIALLVGSLGAFVSLRYPDRSKAQFLYSAAVIGVFSVSILLPQSPINAVARLAIGSATPLSFVTVGAFGVAGVVALIGLREYVKRRGIPSRTETAD